MDLRRRAGSVDPRLAVSMSTPPNVCPHTQVEPSHGSIFCAARLRRGLLHSCAGLFQLGTAWGNERMTYSTFCLENRARLDLEGFWRLRTCRARTDASPPPRSSTFSSFNVWKYVDKAGSCCSAREIRRPSPSNSTNAAISSSSSRARCSASPQT